MFKLQRMKYMLFTIGQSKIRVLMDQILTFDGGFLRRKKIDIGLFENFDI